MNTEATVEIIYSRAKLCTVESVLRYLIENDHTGSTMLEFALEDVVKIGESLAVIDAVNAQPG